MRRVDLATRRLLAVLLGAVAVLTMGGYFLKAQCIGDYDTVRDQKLCSNDIQVLYLNRHLDRHQFPYIHGKLVVNHYSNGDPYDDLTGGTLEYPVLTGLFAWFPALFVHSDGGYLQLTALLLAPFSFLTVFLLARMVRWRALIYAFAPPLVWYSFHNWDLLVVAATTAAMYAWWKQRYQWCAVLLAVGASLKFWPVFFVLPLVLDRLTAKDTRAAVRSVVNFLLASLVINGAFLVASPSGWFAPYRFQQDRAADITSNSIWYWAFSKPVSTGTLNTVVPVLLLTGIAVACGVGWWRGKREGVFPFVQVCGAILCVFMVTNKAHSPQYALWLLPFFCLIKVRWGWWLAYGAFDVLMYVGLFRW
ncbi:MAG: hypothetical protein JWO02_1142, partial [Solirubrobacterales bacterium]|nr:hypothetical protein [Solirubrobacterales bacterium]